MKQFPIYTGWRVHGGAFICAMLISGCTSYIFGLFVLPVTAEFAISRADFNNGFIAFLVGVGVFSPIVGRLLDRFSARHLVMIGGLLFGFSMLALAYSHSLLLMLAIIAGPLSFGAAAAGTLASNTLVARWFDRRRGRALGILAVSTSTGGFICTPLVTLLIESYGWREALMTIGFATITIISAISLFVLRNHPSSRETGYSREFGNSSAAPDDAPAEAVATDNHRAPQAGQMTYGQIFKNRNFWFLALGIGLLYGSDQAMVTSFVPYFRDVGLSAQQAAMIAAIIAISAICGKLVIGFLVERIDIRYAFAAVALAHVGLLTTFLSQPDYWLLLGMTCLFGVGIGGVFPIWSNLLAWLYGSSSYGTIMGIMTIILKLLSIVGVRFVGEMHDLNGSYREAFYIFMLCAVASILFISRLRPEIEPTPRTAVAQA